MERAVEIPVSKELRDKIKTMKQSLTYEEFLIKELKIGKKGDRKGLPIKKSHQLSTERGFS